MDKTISIALGGQIFHITEEAFTILDKYLHAIKAHFEQLDDTDEIITDIESRIAEHFAPKVEKNKKTINKNDVDEIISQMGQVSDFTGEVNENIEPHSSQRASKLYRDTDNQIIAGVAAGVAAYLGVDPTIIRLLFLITVFFGGGSVLFYIIMWILIPEATTTTQKMEMRGKQITLKKLDQTLREKVDPKTIAKTKSIFTRIITIPIEVIKHLATAVQKLSQVLAPVFRIIIGGVLIFVSLTLITVSALAASGIIFNSHSPYIDFPVQAAFVGLQLIVAGIAAFILIFIPLLFSLLIGLSLIKKKNVFNTVVNGTLISIWMIAVVVLGVVGLDVAPRIATIIEEQKNIPPITKTLDIANFSQITVHNNTTVTIKPGETYNISITGRPQDIEDVDIKVDDTTLEISHHGNGICLWCFSNGVTLDITMPKLTRLDLTGASKARVDEFVEQSFELYLSGASVADVAMETKQIKSNLSGTSKAHLTGVGEIAEIQLSGASRL